jgi:hypothetical protein
MTSLWLGQWKQRRRSPPVCVCVSVSGWRRRKGRVLVETLAHSSPFSSPPNPLFLVVLSTIVIPSPEARSAECPRCVHDVIAVRPHDSSPRCHTSTDGHARTTKKNSSLFLARLSRVCRGRRCPPLPIPLLQYPQYTRVTPALIVVRAAQPRSKLFFFVCLFVYNP